VFQRGSIHVQEDLLVLFFVDYGKASTVANVKIWIWPLYPDVYDEHFFASAEPTNMQMQFLYPMSDKVQDDGSPSTEDVWE
jgi:hypothetical protein